MGPPAPCSSWLAPIAKLPSRLGLVAAHIYDEGQIVVVVALPRDVARRTGKDTTAARDETRRLDRGGTQRRDVGIAKRRRRQLSVHHIAREQPERPVGDLPGAPVFAWLNHGCDKVDLTDEITGLVKEWPIANPQVTGADAGGALIDNLDLPSVPRANNGKRRAFLVSMAGRWDEYDGSSGDQPWPDMGMGWVFTSEADFVGDCLEKTRNSRLGEITVRCLNAYSVVRRPDASDQPTGFRHGLQLCSNSSVAERCDEQPTLRSPSARPGAGTR